MKIFWLLTLSGLSAIAFWVGGRDFGNKLIRRIGVSICLLAGIWLWLGFRLSFWWAYVLVFGLSYLAISTYWDFLGIDKGDHDEETPLCWLLAGTGYGLSALPLVWTGVNWYAFLIRVVVLAVGIMLIRKVRDVHIEELVSGALIVLTIPILYL